MDRINDKGGKVPRTCSKCGGNVKVTIAGEPIFKCDKCGEYYGTLPFPDNGQLDECTRGANIMRLNVSDISRLVTECLHTMSQARNSRMVSEDMTRGQVEDTIEDFMKTRDFEKRVNNIVVDVLGDFIENMWTKKSFWKTMIKKK